MRAELDLRVTLFLIAAVGACGTSTPMTQTDSSTPDSSTSMRCAMTMPGTPQACTRAGSTNNCGPVDLSCVGTRTRPTGGAPTTFTLRPSIFATDPAQPVPNVGVSFYPTNQVPLDLSCPAGTCQRVMTNAMGEVSVTAAAGDWFAYIVDPSISADTVQTIQVNEFVPTRGGEQRNANAVGNATLNLIPLSLQLERVPGTAIVAGRIYDCADTGNQVSNAIIRVFGPDGVELVEPAGTARTRGNVIRYFTAQRTPSPSLCMSSESALFGIVNVAIPAGPIRIEAWANDGTLRRIGCEEIRLAPDAVTIANIGPLRSDYPSGSRCAP